MLENKQDILLHIKLTLNRVVYFSLLCMRAKTKTQKCVVYL